MKYFETVEGNDYDELLGGTHIPVEIHNVSLSGGASVSRGELIAMDSLGAWSPVANLADANKALAIAINDCAADSLGAVTQAYKSGAFNREKIICGAESASLSVDTFEQELRKQNIHLTSLKDY